MPSTRRARPYESPLRAEHMDRTREKLIEAGIDLVTDAGNTELTIREVAARAGVSVPTAYRHFSDRDTLFEAMALWIGERVSGPNVPTNVEEVPTWARHVYASFEANDRLMRAQLTTPAGRMLRAKKQKERYAKFFELTKQSFPSSSPTAQRRLTALVQVLITVPAWVSLHDNWGMSGAEAGEATAWAIETLLAEARRRPTALDFELPAGSPLGAPNPPSATRARERPSRPKARRTPKSAR